MGSGAPAEKSFHLLSEYLVKLNIYLVEKIFLTSHIC
jgi:hypothetical protein